MQELGTIVTTVVDKITLNIVRLHGLGIRNIIVSNLAVMACSPYITVASNYSTCSRNTTLLNETMQHNGLLEKRVRLLKHSLHGSHLVIVNQTKAFEFMFEHGHKYGERSNYLISISAAQFHHCHIFISHHNTSSL